MSAVVNVDGTYKESTPGGGIGQWAKPLNGMVIAGAAAVITALQNGQIEVGEWLGIAATVLAAFLGISFIKNAQTGWRRYAKAIVGGLVAFLGALVTGVGEGGWPPSSSQLIIAVVALLNAWPVYWSPNAAESDKFRLARGGL